MQVRHLDSNAPLARLIMTIFAGLLVMAAAGAYPQDKPDAAATTDTNLLTDPGFATLGQGNQRHWVMTQHAGEQSYQVSAEDGVMILERIASESWGQVYQRLDAMPLRGKILEFRAEVRGEFLRTGEAAGSHTGIGYQIKGLRPGLPRVLGAAILITRYAEPGLMPEDREWTTQTIRFEVPDNATSLEVSLMLGRWGKLYTRKPRLVEIRPASS